MEKINKVIAGLRGCVAGNCSNCDYTDSDCGRDRLMKDAADLIEQLEMDLEVTRMNLADARSELNRLENEVEPIVHAHWDKLPSDYVRPFLTPSYTHSCSKCGIHGYKHYKRCYDCGAIMDEKVIEPTPLIRLDLGGRINKRLKEMGVFTVEQLEAMDKHTLHNIPGLGKKSIEIIETELRIWKMEKEKNGKAE